MTMRRRLSPLRTLLPLLLLTALGNTACAQMTGAAPTSPEEANTIAVFERAAPAVVFIVNKQKKREPFTTRELIVPVGTGSGFAVSSDGLILTNAHVVEGASVVEVTLRGGVTLPAQLVGIAPDKDIALLKIELPAGPFAHLEPGSSGTLRVGQKVLAIGNPFGLDHTLTVGVVSALDREIEAPTGRRIRGMIQTDASINPGNSGGPLLDSAGRVVGMNSAIFSPSGEGSVGIGFAVPVDTIQWVIPQLAQYGRLVRPTLGVIIAEPPFSATLGLEGIAVLDVAPNSGAANAGMIGLSRDAGGVIRLGDVIVSVNGAPVKVPDDLFEALERRVPGEKVTVQTRRGSRELSLQVVLGAAN